MDPDFGLSEVLDESKYWLDHILKKERDPVNYEYDFGDGWEHKIILGKILPFDSDVSLPVCVKGKGACPPEDVGGIWGYHHLLKVLADQSHPEHEEYIEWVADEFDPAAYNIEEVYKQLARYHLEKWNMPTSGLDQVRHIYDGTTYLSNASQDLDEGSFSRDDMLKRAFVRRIEIIGKASKKISDVLDSYDELFNNSLPR